MPEGLRRLYQSLWCWKRLRSSTKPLKVRPFSAIARRTLREALEFQA